MKRTITTVLAIALSFAGVSCSVQEDAIVQEENVTALNQGDKVLFNDAADADKFAKAFTGAYVDLKIDFVTLFKYTNEKELIGESERIYTLALEDMKDELTRHKGAAYMALTVDVNNGLGAIKGVYFLNNRKDTAVEQMIANSNKEYDTTYSVPVVLLNKESGYKLISDTISTADAKVLSGYLADKVSTSGKTGSFMLVSSADSASLYLKS